MTKLWPLMTRSVVISGLGPLSAIGHGIEPTWEAMCAGRTGIGPLQAFDPGGYDCHIAAEVTDFSARKVVPKSYRKGVKVMARDIEFAVGGAHFAAEDANLATRGNSDGEPTYDPARVGCHIGAALIAADVNELTAAMARSTGDDGAFDIHKFGGEGITHVTPLWLLKFLPNMLACHVTIIHDAQGPSNTITCNLASSHLSIGESLRVIQRGAADLCFCGGMESKVDPLSFLRLAYTGQINPNDNDHPDTAYRAMSQDAGGAIPGEGGAIAILEARDTFEKRDGARAYAQVLGFGASQSVHRESRNLKPDPEGRGIANAVRAAMREADLEPQQIDAIIPCGMGLLEYDRPEAAALRAVFADALGDIFVAPIKPMIGMCGAGSGGLDICAAAKALHTQTLPATINCDTPLDGLKCTTAPSRPAELNHVLVITTSLGGQNAAIVLGRLEA